MSSAAATAAAAAVSVPLPPVGKPDVDRCVHMDACTRALLTTAHPPFPSLSSLPCQVDLELPDVRAERERVEALPEGGGGQAVTIRDLHKVFPPTGGNK